MKNNTQKHITETGNRDTSKDSVDLPKPAITINREGIKITTQKC